MKKIKIFPKMFIQIFSVLAIIIILVHSLVYFIFPKTYLETRREKKRFIIWQMKFLVI